MLEGIEETGLTEKDEDFCTTTGAIGILLSLVCLGQHIMIIQQFTIIAAIMWSIFIYAAVVYIFLIRRSSYAPLLMLISGILQFFYIIFLICLFFFAATLIFSYTIFFLFTFTVVVTILMYVYGMHKRLKLHKQLKHAEDNFWADKL